MTVSPGNSEQNQQTHFLERAKPVWDELESLLDKARRNGLRGLSAEELARLDQLYRQTTVHLAQVRSRSRNPHLLSYLNRLVGRAHSFVYVSPPRYVFWEVLRFYATGFPRAVARTAPFHLTAAALFLLAGVFAHFAAHDNSMAAYALSMPGDIRLPGSTPEQLESVLRSGRDASEAEKSIFTAFLFTHNTRVGFLAFASGILAGAPTVYILVFNGAMLGAFTSMHHQQGIVAEMWAWLLPHGVPEIGAILLCGGAGLMLGMALLRPGNLSRAQSLVEAGREALRLLLGVIPMFLIAAFIEGFLRQSELGTAARLAFAALAAAAMLAYFGLGAYVEWKEKQAPSASAPNGGDIEGIRASSSL